MRMPEAEIEVSADLARSLITEQHPDLAGPLRLVANGWDNVIFALGDDLLVRLPRRAMAAQLVITEKRWLPLLAPALPAPVPVPLRVGTPTADYPWHWSICRWIPGRPLIELDVADRAPAATALAEFLAALHRPAPAAARSGPERAHSTVRGVDLADRDALAEEQLGGPAVPEPDRLRSLWRRLVATPALDADPAWPQGPVWVHGDPHPGNLLVDPGEPADPNRPLDPCRLAAVLDFGDLTVGDPATDLAAGWLSFDEAGRRMFVERYTALTGATSFTWDRARGWALTLGLSLLTNSDDNPALASVARHALHQLR